MLIKSLIEREGGTVVELDGIKYSFKPTKDISDHVCNIEDDVHIEKLLAVKEGFIEHGLVTEASMVVTIADVEYDLDSMTKQEIVALGSEHGVELGARMSKAKMVALLSNSESS